jgi:hypothetical protein
VQLPELPGHPVLPIAPGGPPPAVGWGKPGGVPVLPMDPSWKPPVNPPQPPGFWVCIDAGTGQPPAWGYITHQTPPGPKPPDHGLGGPPVAGNPLPPTPPTPPVAVPAGGAPTPGPAGHYVPVGIDAPKSGGEPTWAFVPEIGKDYGVKTASPGPK